MSRSSFRSLIAIAALAVSAASRAFVTAAVASRAYVVGAVTRARDFLLNAFTPATSIQPKEPSEHKPRMALVAAKAFIQRLAKRERPRVTPMWRMCPST